MSTATLTEYLDPEASSGNPVNVAQAHVRRLRGVIDPEQDAQNATRLLTTNKRYRPEAALGR